MKHFFHAIICISLFACSSEPENQSASDGFQLPDSLFAYLDIENTLVMENVYWDANDFSKVYTDSSAKKPFVKLDSIQKLRLMAPVTGIDSGYIVQYMDAFFVAKQKPIGGLTPVLIYLYGDDYSSLHYLLLDKTLRPVGNFIVSGGEGAGPIDETDSTITLPPLIHTFFKADKLFSYSLTETMSTETADRPSVFDSVYYEHTIEPMGKIRTKRLDSVRFERMPKK